MTKGSTIRHNRGFTVALALFLICLTGCQEESRPDEESTEISLNFVAKDISYASLPLIGTNGNWLGLWIAEKARSGWLSLMG